MEIEYNKNSIFKKSNRKKKKPKYKRSNFKTKLNKILSKSIINIIIIIYILKKTKNSSYKLCK